MKITDHRPATKVGSVKRVAAPAAGQPAAGRPAATTRSVGDVASFMGIAPEELTPNVREGLSKLIAEVDRLRRDTEEKDRRIAYLERLADEDPLMPVLNRRAFVRELSRMMAFADRYGAASSVIYFDMNGMKAINDTYGHAAGDAALSHVATTLVDHVRSSDVVGRLGGDEFGVLLAQAGQVDANTKGASLAELIGSTPFTFEQRALSVSVSYGAFAFDGNGEPIDVLNAADQAMYQHKQRSG